MLTAEESEQKRIWWEEENREYLAKQQAKELAAKQAAESGQPKERRVSSLLFLFFVPCCWELVGILRLG